jgi:hypothetical protein
VKKSSLALIIGSFFSFSLFFASCTKINEGTILGDDLIPAVDNITTFDTTLEVLTDNFLFNDSTNVIPSDDMALGTLNDPEFGQTTASVFFNISLPRNGNNPGSQGSIPAVDSSSTFFKASKDSIFVDSVILTLDYRGVYGDSNSVQQVQVYEIPQGSDFYDTAYYRLNHPEFPTGALLGSRSFVISTLDDSTTVVRGGDTSRVANVMRIPLQVSVGQRFAAFDRTNTANGGLHNDSTLRKLFPGFAVKASGANALTYVNLSTSNTGMIIYYRSQLKGVKDTTAVQFVHANRFFYRNPGDTFSRPAAGGQANTIVRTPGGNFAAALNNGNPEDPQLYIQTTPGSYATVSVPGLANFGNHVIHRAELIAPRISSALDNILTPPASLFLDLVNANDDSLLLLDRDIAFNQGGGIDLNSFGGRLRPDQNYIFNITRHVQGIATRNEPNRVFRLYTPYDVVYAVPNSTSLRVNAITQPANGRVVLGGGNHPEPARRTRVRIIYSKI